MIQQKYFFKKNLENSVSNNQLTIEIEFLATNRKFLKLNALRPFSPPLPPLTPIFHSFRTSHRSSTFLVRSKRLLLMVYSCHYIPKSWTESFEICLLLERNLKIFCFYHNLYSFFWNILHNMLRRSIIFSSSHINCIVWNW